MSLLPPIEYADAAPAVKAVYDDIMATRKVAAVNNFWKVLTLFFLCAIFVAVMTHATGFSKAAGTLFTGVNTLGTTLEAGNIKAGQ